MIAVNSIEAATIANIHLWLIGTRLVPSTQRIESLQSVPVLVDVVRKLSPAMAQLAEKQKDNVNLLHETRRYMSQVLGGAGECLDPIGLLQTSETEIGVAAAWKRMLVFALKCDGQQQNLQAICSLRDDLQQLLIVVYRMAVEELTRNDSTSEERKSTGQTTSVLNGAVESDSRREPPSSPGSLMGSIYGSHLQAQLEASESKNASPSRTLEKMQRVEQVLENAELQKKSEEKENEEKLASKDRPASCQNDQEVAVATSLKEHRQEKAEIQQFVGQYSEDEHRSPSRAPLRTVNCQNSPQQLDVDLQTTRVLHQSNTKNGSVFRQIDDQTSNDLVLPTTGVPKPGSTASNRSSEVVNPPESAGAHPQRSQSVDEGSVASREKQQTVSLISGATSALDSYFPTEEVACSNWISVTGCTPRAGCSPQVSIPDALSPEKPHSEGDHFSPEKAHSVGERSTLQEKACRNTVGKKHRRPRAIESQGKVLKVPEPGREKDCKQQ